MNPQQFEIYRVDHQWKDCKDPRPWLVVDVKPNSIYGCFPIASQCYYGRCFYIESGHPDFVSTGLSRSCYIHDESIVEISLSEFLQCKGCLTGVLLKEFREYAGL